MIRETLDDNSTSAYAFLNIKKGAALIYHNGTNGYRNLYSPE